MDSTATMTLIAPLSTRKVRYGWEKGPLQLISTPKAQAEAPKTDDFTYAASEMALVHNCIIRGFNSIYIQAPHVPAIDHRSFIMYCISVYQGLEAHHDGEEDFLFPEIERYTDETGLMQVNVRQHEAFHSGFEAWGDWLRRVRDGGSVVEFDGAKCRRLMDAFMVPLAQHLADEISTLLTLSKYEGTLPIRQLLKQEGDTVMGTRSKTTQLPMFLLNHDTTFEGGIHHFPPIPAPIIFVLREVLGRWNADWWKFSTVGFNGMPRDLLYGGN